ncbi:MAG: hypothetical protein O9273_15025 [Acetobacteraceae bacterium]|nr:hypothetical protein [Acetobacteraceae bacterium]
MQNTPGIAERTASPTCDRVGKSRGYFYARFPKVKGMVRCAVLFMGLSLIAGCALSPRENLTEAAQRALSPSLGQPELVQEAHWYILDSNSRDTGNGCRGAIIIYQDRFIMLRRKLDFTTRYERGRNISGQIQQVTESRCGKEFFSSPGETVYFFRDIHPTNSTFHPGLFGVGSFIEVQVPFGAALSQLGRPPTPKILVLELPSNSEIPTVLERRRRQ